MEAFRTSEVEATLLKHWDPEILCVIYLRKYVTFKENFCC